MQLPQEEWETLIAGACPGYLSWEDYQQNLKRLHESGDKDAALAAGYSLSVAENTKQRIWKQRVRNEFEGLRCVIGCDIAESRRTGINPNSLEIPELCREPV